MPQPQHRGEYPADWKIIAQTRTTCADDDGRSFAGTHCRSDKGRAGVACSASDNSRMALHRHGQDASLATYLGIFRGVHQPPYGIGGRECRYSTECCSPCLRLCDGARSLFSRSARTLQGGTSSVLSPVSFRIVPRLRAMRSAARRQLHRLLSDRLVGTVSTLRFYADRPHRPHRDLCIGSDSFGSSCICSCNKFTNGATMGQAKQRGEYPAEWARIAKEIKDAANWKCVRCNHAHCVKSGHVLTVHHLDGDRSNCERYNCAALCQRCHLSVQARVDPAQGLMHEPSVWSMPYIAGMVEAGKTPPPPGYDLAGWKVGYERRGHVWPWWAPIPAVTR